MVATIKGKQITIPDKDRQQTEVWTRVMGYYRPLANFNKGKKSEFRERVWFREQTVNARISDIHKENEEK